MKRKIAQDPLKGLEKAPVGHSGLAQAALDLWTPGLQVFALNQRTVQLK